MATARPIGEIVEDLSVGPYHWRLLVVVGCAIGFAAVEILVISFVLPILIDQWGLSGLQAGTLGSATLIGLMAGNWIGGWYSDVNGRYAAFQWAVVAYSITVGLTAFATGFYSALLLRILTGVAVGSSITIAIAYLSEHVPTDYRGRFLVYVEVFWPLGTITVVAVSWAVLVRASTDGYVAGIPAWRVLFLVCALPMLFVVVIRRELAESPYYLANAGRTREAAERIREIARLNGSSVQIDRTMVAPGARNEEAVGVRTLFNPALRKRTVVVCIAWFGINFGFYGVFIWLPETLETVALGGNTYRQLFWVAVVQLPGILSAAYLIDRLGRKPTIGSYVILSGICTLLFAAGFVGESTWLPVSPLAPLLLASFFLIGAWGPMFVYTTELYPTEVRGRGFGFASAVGRIASISGPILAGVLVEWGYFVTLSPFGIGLTVAGLVVLGFGLETADTTMS